MTPVRSAAVFERLWEGKRGFLRWWFGAAFTLGLWIGAGAGQAEAATTVILKYHSDRTAIAFDELESFVQTGEVPEAMGPLLEEADFSAEALRTLLAEPIPGVRLGRTDLEFVSIQVAKTIGDPLERDSRRPVAQALVASFAGDRTLSILEILENYPERDVRLDLARLGGLQRDVDLYINRIAVLLRVVEQLLPDLVCDCGFEDATVQNARPPQALVAQAAETITSGSGGSSSRSSSTCAMTLAAQLPEQVSDQSMPAPSLFRTAQAAASRAIAMDRTSSSRPLTSLTSGTLGPVYSDMRAIAQTAQTPSESSIQRVVPVNRISRQVVIAFGPLRPSFSIQGLNAFVETGATSPGWRFYLNLAGLNQEDLRALLTKEIAVDAKFLDRNLNMLLGEYILFRVSDVVHTPSRVSDIQALRSALLLSALDDNKFSLLEILQNYPSEVVIVEGLNLARLATNIQEQGAVSTVTADVEDLLLEFQSSVAATVCECGEE